MALQKKGKLTEEIKQIKKNIEAIQLKISIAKAKLRTKGLEQEAELLEQIEELL